MACEISASQPGIEPTHPALESEVLTTEPPGKSLQAVLKLFFSLDSQTVLSEGVMIIPILEKQTRQKMCLEGKWLGVEPRPTVSSEHPSQPQETDSPAELCCSRQR